MMGSTRPTRQLTLGTSAEACADARAQMRDLLDAAAIHGETRETAVLLANELVSNAIEHGGDPATLTAAVEPDAIRIEVTDASPALPAPSSGYDEFSERGRGLLLVAALASRWGTDTQGVGKRVWCEIDVAG